MSFYIVGYTVNGQDFGLRNWYMDSVWAIAPNSTIESRDSKINVFKTHALAEKYYRRACTDFWKNLKPEFRGGKVWIRKVNSSKNPFTISPVDPNGYSFNYYGYDKLPFWKKPLTKPAK